MAGGGTIIIRNKVRAAAELDMVRDSLPTSTRSRLEHILAKSDADWSDGDFHFVNRCVAEAYDVLC